MLEAMTHIEELARSHWYSQRVSVDDSALDQCPRIYWTDDPEGRRWKITHIGRHK